MKNILFLLALLATISMNAQTDFALTKDGGLTEAVVTETPGMSANDLYNKSLDWIAAKYKDPREVILSAVENDFIRLEGIQSDLFCLKQGCESGRYQVKLSFKDGKYRFEIISLEQKIAHAWVPVDFKKNSDFYFDQNGLKKKFQAYGSIPVFFTALNNDLINSFTNKNDNW